MRRGVWFTLLFAASLVLCSAAHAQEAADTSANAPKVEPLSEPIVAERLSAVQQELARPDTGDASRALLGQLESTLRQQLQLLQAAAQEPVDAKAFEAEVPASISELRQLYERLVEDEAREVALGEALGASREALARARERGDAAGKSLRKAQAEAADASDLRRAELEARLAAEQVRLKQLELAAAERAVQEHGSRTAAVRALIAEAKDAVRSQAAGDDLHELTRREGEIEREREVAGRELARAELELSAASRRYEAQLVPEPPALERVETLTLARDAVAQRLGILDGQLERVREQRTLWEGWLGATRGQLRGAELRTWQEERSGYGEALARLEIQKQGRLADLQERLDAIASRLRTTPQDDPLARSARLRRDTLADLLALHRDDAQDLGLNLRLNERLLADVQEETGSASLTERLARIGSAARDLWNYEITTADDRPITVGSAVIALVLFFAGLWLAQLLSQWLRRGVDSRFQLEPGIAAALQTGAFYTLIVFFSLLALRTVNFPLTAFTVLGGALAIGIGFGSQNVMNNFISGVILMLERPVRSGDLVEVEGTHGIVEHIGARSTRIRATDSRHLIVPNSFFLENNVVNWTLSDDIIRTYIDVGIIYGSPTRAAEKILRQVLDENPKVLPAPLPVVVFTEFGDNSLNFQAYFWLRARGPMDVRRVESEVRFRIDDLFREAGIVIAFPQRDVHLDSVRPIEVRVLDRDRDPDPSD